MTKINIEWWRMVEMTHENVSRSYNKGENLRASSALCNQDKD
jgi:hypothetical protein